MSENAPEPKVKVSWAPQPGPQEHFINLPDEVDEVLYGGARGGGKSDSALGDALICSVTYPNTTCVFFRRTLKQLDGLIERSKQIYPLHKAEYKESDKRWVFPNGSRVLFRYLDKDSDAEEYQGWSVQRVYFEELGNFPTPIPYFKMKGILRGGECPKRLVATANPGGPGHQWVRQRFVTPAPLGYTPIVSSYKHPTTGEEIRSTRVYIPSKVWDNPELLKVSPNYIANLYETGSKEVVDAWLYGNWDAILGAYFPEFSTEKHVIKECELPPHWNRFIAGDWGSASPFAFYWIAVASEAWQHPSGKVIPKGALVIYREWYGICYDQNGDPMPNKGVKLHAEVVGQGLAARTVGDTNVSMGIIDPSAFAQDGGPSIAERIMTAARGVPNSPPIVFRRADNKRTPKKGALGGWDALRSRLVGEKIAEDHDEPTPMIYFFDTCEHLIRTLPALQHDETNPEDLDTESEDHAADAVRYGCMSRPWRRNPPAPPTQALTWQTARMRDVSNVDRPRKSDSSLSRI